MGEDYFVGILYLLALVVVFVPLVLALHFHHVDDKRKIHNLYSTDDDRSVNRNIHDSDSVVVQCAICGHRAITSNHVQVDTDYLVA